MGSLRSNTVSQPYLSDWSVIVSVVGAGAALLAIWYMAITHRLTVTERREAQASLVSTWAENWSHTFDTGEAPRFSNFYAIVCNSSKQPIYETHIALLPPNWRNGETPVASRIIGVLTPESESEPIPMPSSPGYEDGGFVAPAMEIEFTDNRGRRWLRRPDGDLSEVKVPKAFRWL